MRGVLCMLACAWLGVASAQPASYRYAVTAWDGVPVAHGRVAISRDARSLVFETLPNQPSPMRDGSACRLVRRDLDSGALSCALPVVGQDDELGDFTVSDDGRFVVWVVHRKVGPARLNVMEMVGRSHREIDTGYSIFRRDSDPQISSDGQVVLVSEQLVWLDGSGRAPEPAFPGWVTRKMALSGDGTRVAAWALFTPAGDDRASWNIIRRSTSSQEVEPWWVRYREPGEVSLGFSGQWIGWSGVDPDGYGQAMQWDGSKSIHGGPLLLDDRLARTAFAPDCLALAALGIDALERPRAALGMAVSDPDRYVHLSPPKEYNDGDSEQVLDEVIAVGPGGNRVILAATGIDLTGGRAPQGRTLYVRDQWVGWSNGMIVRDASGRLGLLRMRGREPEPVHVIPAWGQGWRTIGSVTSWLRANQTIVVLARGLDSWGLSELTTGGYDYFGQGDTYESISVPWGFEAVCAGSLFRFAPNRSFQLVTRRSDGRWGVMAGGYQNPGVPLEGIAEGWEVIAAADVDGQQGFFRAEGRSDLVVREVSTGRLGAYLWDNGSIIGWLSLGYVPRGWRLIGFQDFDRDLDADMILFREADRLISARVIQNGRFVGWKAMTNAPADWDPVQPVSFADAQG